MLRTSTCTATRIVAQVWVRLRLSMQIMCTTHLNRIPNLRTTACTRVRNKSENREAASVVSSMPCSVIIFIARLPAMQGNKRISPGVPVASSQGLHGCLPTRSVARSAELDPAKPRATVYNVQYDIYKGRSAIQFKPIMPTYRKAADGNLELSRRGCLLLELANSNGKRSYSWSEKITFAMSITELSQLFLTSAVLSGQVVDLFHDPGMGSSTQGQVLSPCPAVCDRCSQQVLPCSCRIRFHGCRPDNCMACRSRSP